MSNPRAVIFADRAKQLVRQRNTRLLGELERQGVSLKHFCKQIGVRRETVWRYENGLVGPPGDFYTRAAAVLGVPVETIAPDGLHACKGAVDAS